MITDLKYYVQHQKGFLPETFCDKILDELKSVKFEKNTFYNARTKKHAPRSGNQELLMSWQGTPSKNELTGKLWHAIDKYIKTIKMPWFNGWQGYTAVRFNKYKKNKKMALHCDHIRLFENQMSNLEGVPILSVVGTLNDDYKGGEFILFDDYEIKFGKGDVLVFPSSFLYPHKVKPVKRGTRYSYVSWVC